jgi:hypothetical protein
MALNELAARKVRALTEHLAYELWEHRGQPLGSPEVDWLSAEKCLASVLGESVLPVYSFRMGPNEGPCR